MYHKRNSQSTYYSASSADNNNQNNNSNNNNDINDYGSSEAMLASIFALGQSHMKMDSSQAGSYFGTYASPNIQNGATFNLTNVETNGIGAANDTLLSLPRPRPRRSNSSTRPRYRPKIRYERTSNASQGQAQSHVPARDFINYVASMPHIVQSEYGSGNDVDIVDIKVEPLLLPNSILSQQSQHIQTSLLQQLNQPHGSNSILHFTQTGSNYTNDTAVNGMALNQKFAQFGSPTTAATTNEEQKLQAAFYKRQYSRILATERQRQRRAQMSEAERAATREVNRIRNRQRRSELKQLAERALEMGISAETQARLNALRKSLGMRPMAPLQISKINVMSHAANEYVKQQRNTEKQQLANVKTEVPNENSNSHVDFYIQPARGVEQIVAQTVTGQSENSGDNFAEFFENIGRVNNTNENGMLANGVEAEFTQLMSDLMANNALNHKQECEDAYYVRERARLLKTKRRALNATERAERRERLAAQSPRERALHNFARRQRRQRAQRMAAKSVTEVDEFEVQKKDNDDLLLCFEGKPARSEISVEGENLATLTAHQLSELAEYEKRNFAKSNNADFSTLNAGLEAILNDACNGDDHNEYNKCDSLNSTENDATTSFLPFGDSLTTLFGAIESMARKCRDIAQDNKKMEQNRGAVQESIAQELAKIKLHIAKIEEKIPK